MHAPPAPVLRTANSPASLAGQVAVRSTRAQHSRGDKCGHQLCQLLRALELGPMATVLDETQGCPGDGTLVELSTFYGDDLILSAPHDERGDAHFPQHAR